MGYFLSSLKKTLNTSLAASAIVSTPRSDSEMLVPVMLINIVCISVILESIFTLTADILSCAATRVEFCVELKERLFVFVAATLVAR